MDPHIVLGILIGVPVLLLTLLRVNAATAFLALCLGSLLGSYVSDDVVQMLRGYVAPNSQVTEAVVSLVLLWLPVVLVMIFMAHTIGARQRLINLLPALAVGLVGALLSVPFFTPEAQITIYASTGWRLIENNQALIVVLGTVASLVLLRMRKPLHEGGKPKHH